MINDAVCDELIVEWQAACSAVLFVTVSCELVCCTWLLNQQSLITGLCLNTTRLRLERPVGPGAVVK